MIPSDVIAIALQRTNMTLAELGDGDATVGETRAYQYINMTKDSVWSAIVASSTGKDFNWEEWTNELTAGESEYALPQVVLDENRLKKIQNLSIAYTVQYYTRTGDMIYTSVRYVDRKNMEKEWDWYRANQPESDPIYCVSDKSIFIAPVPLTTIANGLKMTGVKKIPDYDENTTEEGMIIPDDYHYLLVDGLEVEFLRKQGATALANQQKQVFLQSRQEALSTIKESNTGCFQMTYPYEPFSQGNRYPNSHITLPYNN